LKQNNQIVGFYSHKFNDTESRYTTMEKEALGILKSLEFFRDYIIDSQITILTDNKNLLFDTNIAKRVQRWKILLEEFNISLKEFLVKIILWLIQFQEFLTYVQTTMIAIEI
ncbi:Transposon Tf2-8 polyprotein, partial [Dictyocoela muelleri]